MIPKLISAYLERALSGERPPPRQVRIAQAGQMWMKPGASPRRFTAVQHLAVDRVAFSWRARFPLLPAVAMTVVDGFAEGKGALEVRLLGIPLQRQRGAETSVGEAMRYLAELPLVPYAMAHNAELRWRESGERSVEVATDVGGTAIPVTLEFGPAGDIVRASTAGRPFGRKGAWTPTPWAGEFSGYRQLGGIRLPICAEAYWDLPAGRFVYWRGEILSAVALGTPFGA